ncbi:MAG: SDR family NAD(P)-dependent oxidoreductase [Ignavibacteria bacterium]|nr:SDR family NAD(P)-dependent oxidoreductase [Ignavibacteria bacterium]
MKFDKIDVLIHNAAAFDLSQKRQLITSENIESIWATNHVGPVLLSNLLLNKIKNSNQGRIITIASQGLAFQPKLSINFDDPEFRRNKFSVPKAYYQSKLAQIMYTYWFADELKSTEVTVNCIRVTNVKIDINRYPNLPFLFRLAYKIKGSFSISPEEMAETYAYLTLEPKLRNLTGKYFDHKKGIVKSSAYSYKKENIEKLIDLTNKYILNS